MKICVYSQIGKGKSECEDAAMVDDMIISDSYFEIQTEQTHTVAIADGVGGNTGGECASRYVLEKLCEVSMADVSVEYL